MQTVKEEPWKIVTDDDFCAFQEYAVSKAEKNLSWTTKAEYINQQHMIRFWDYLELDAL